METRKGKSRMKTIFIAISAMLLAPPVLASETTPYAGLETREIATLSEKDVDDLLAGRGWGFALAAELNGYPGPAHVLELAEELALTETQRVEVQAIFDAMNARARVLGAEFVATYSTSPSRERILSIHVPSRFIIP